MSILTKISVVILLLAVALACPIFITQAVVPDNYKELYLEVFAQKQMLGQANRQANLALQSAQEGWKQDRQRLVELESKGKADLQALATKLDEQSAENVRNKEAQADNAAKLGQLQLSLDAAIKRNEEVSKMLDAERADKNKSQEELRVTAENLSQRNLDLEHSQKNVDYLQEQIGELKDQNRSLRDQLASKGIGVAAMAAGGAAKEAAQTAEPEVKVDGTITLVRNDLASINVGSAQGVRKGMKMMIYRDKVFVAYLQVQDVDVNTAGGVVVNRQVDPVVGDKVETVR